MREARRKRRSRNAPCERSGQSLRSELPGDTGVRIEVDLSDLARSPLQFLSALCYCDFVAYVTERYQVGVLTARLLCSPSVSPSVGSRSADTPADVYSTRRTDESPRVRRGSYFCRRLRRSRWMLGHRSHLRSNTSEERKGLQVSIWLYLLIIVLAVLAFGGYRRYSRR